MPSMCGVTYVQVGANCGKPGCGSKGLLASTDPVWTYANRYKWRGAVIEANPTTYEVLHANYLNASAGRVEALNVAISNVSGFLEFFCPQAKDGWSAMDVSGVSEHSLLHRLLISALYSARCSSCDDAPQSRSLSLSCMHVCCFPIQRAAR